MWRPLATDLLPHVAQTLAHWAQTFELNESKAEKRRPKKR